jgi:hypothetical protein
MRLTGKIELVFLFFAVGCASTTNPSANTRPRAETVTIDVPNAPSSRVVIRDDPASTTAALTVSPAQAWAAVPSAFAALGIPIVTLDSTHRFVRGAASAYHQFQRSPLSRFFDCGTTLVGPTADTYHLQLVIESQVDSVSDAASVVHTRVGATGSGSGGSVRCSTTGSLERLINDQVKALLGNTE